MVDEIVDAVLPHSIGELHLKQAGAYVEHPLLRIELLAAHSDGVDKVGLAASRRPVDEEGVESRLPRVLGNRYADGTRQLVAVALDEIRERVAGVELGVQPLRHGGVERGGRLVGPCGARRLNVGRLLSIDFLGEMVLLVGHYAVSQHHVRPETTGQHLVE